MAALVDIHQFLLLLKETGSPNIKNRVVAGKGKGFLSKYEWYILYSNMTMDNVQLPKLAGPHKKVRRRFNHSTKQHIA